jgi:hypothetical protein
VFLKHIFSVMRTECKVGEHFVLLLINNYMENKGSRESVGSRVARLQTRRPEVRNLKGAKDLSLFLKVLFGKGSSRPPI